MKWPRNIAVIHGIGVVAFAAVLSIGYFFVYQPWSVAASRVSGLESSLAEYDRTIQELSKTVVQPVAGTGLGPSHAVGSEAGLELVSLTPTVFLSTFENHARNIGLRVESSLELEPKLAGNAKSPLLVEVTGGGTFAGVVELCERLEAALPGLEIRRLRVERGADEAVRWTMVCMNYDSFMGQE